MAEVARGLEVARTCCIAGSVEFFFRQAPGGNAFPATGSGRWSEGQIRNWNARSVAKAVEIEFFVRGACSASRNNGCCRYRLEIRSLPQSRGRSDRRPGRLSIERMVELGRVSRQLLPLHEDAEACQIQT